MSTFAKLPKTNVERWTSGFSRLFFLFLCSFPSRLYLTSWRPRPLDTMLRTRMVQEGWRVTVTGVRDEPPRLVQHILYSAVKMAASEGARSGRTTEKRLWNAPDLNGTPHLGCDIICSAAEWTTSVGKLLSHASQAIVLFKAGWVGFYW